MGNHIPGRKLDKNPPAVTASEFGVLTKCGMGIRYPNGTCVYMMNREGRANQKIAGLKGFDRYWLEILQKGELPSRHGYPDDDGWPLSRTRVVKAVIHQAYLEWFEHQRCPGWPSSEGSTGIALKKACPGVAGLRVRRKGGHNRYYVLPPLADCRKAFADHLQIPVGHLPAPSNQNDEDDDYHDGIDDLLG